MGPSSLAQSRVSGAPRRAAGAGVQQRARPDTPFRPWYSVPMPTDVAKVHLAIYGQTREITLDVRVGDATLLDLFEPAAELSRQVSAIAVQQAAAEGKAVRCAEGCAACCRHLLPVSPAEARRLADVVARMPE